MPSACPPPVVTCVFRAMDMEIESKSKHKPFFRGCKLVVDASSLV